MNALRFDTGFVNTEPVPATALLGLDSVESRFVSPSSGVGRRLTSRPHAAVTPNRGSHQNDRAEIRHGLLGAKCTPVCVSALTLEPAGLSAWRTLDGHCPRLDQGNGWLAVGLRGVDEGLDSGRGKQQAGLADPATGAPRLASVTRTNHHDDARAASQVAHRFYGTTLSKRDRPAADRAQWPRLSVGVLPSHGCHHENWIADVILSRET